MIWKWNEDPDHLLSIHSFHLNFERDRTPNVQQKKWSAGVPPAKKPRSGRDARAPIGIPAIKTIQNAITLLRSPVFQKNHEINDIAIRVFVKIFTVESLFPKNRQRLSRHEK
jgi:hypothetical protein